MSCHPTWVKQQGRVWRVFLAFPLCSKGGLFCGACGVVRDEIFPEILKSPGENVFPGGSGESDIKVQVVNTDEAEAENFLRFDQMPEIGAGEIPARIAATSFLDRRAVFRVGGIFEIDRPSGGKGGAISRQPGGKHTIKHIHPASDHFDDLGRGSQAHRVAGVVVWQERDGAFDGAKHLGLGFAHAHAANGVTVKSNIHKRTGTFFTEVRVG